MKLGLGLRVQYPQKVGGAAPFSGLLDSVTGAAFAASVRLLRAGYSGGLARVIAYDGASQHGSADVMPYKIGDNYWIDLNSTLANLDTIATGRGLTSSDTLADLCSVGVNDYDGLVSTWYDQSVNAFNATQTSLSSMPKLINQGLIYTKNGKPAINNVVNGRLINGSLSTSGDFATCIVGQSEEQNESMFIDSLNNSPNFVGRSSGTRLTYLNATEPSPSDNSTRQITALKTSTIALRINNTEVNATSFSPIYDGLSLFNLRGNPNPVASGYDLNGSMQEVIIYDRNITSDLNEIESDQISGLNIQI